MSHERFEIARPARWGFADSVELDACGLIRISGWSTGSVSNGDAPRVKIQLHEIPFLQMYRFERGDVEAVAGGIPQAGLVFEYLVPETLCHQAMKSHTLSISGLASFRLPEGFEFLIPHYKGLFDSRDVLHRENMYGSGPPNRVSSPEAIALAESLTGRILDFGCGSGALIRHLRSKGFDAYGIELDSPIIRQHMYPEMSPFITLYAGEFPSPFAEKAFDCVFCSEVLEHIPDFQGAVAELARLARKKVLITVPDMSAIPVGFRHGIIPWHLLERTHVNFFTQTSLEHLLRRHFSQIEFGRVSLCKVNESHFFTSLVALARSESKPL
jgi:SAM-dependent methyltransferase